MEVKFDTRTLERLRQTLALGDRPLLGWPAIVEFCRQMEMKTKLGTYPQRETLKKKGLPYVRQGKHGEAWTTTFLVVSWYVGLPGRPHGKVKPWAGRTKEGLKVGNYPGMLSAEEARAAHEAAQEAQSGQAEQEGN